MSKCEEQMKQQTKNSERAAGALQPPFKLDLTHTKKITDPSTKMDNITELNKIHA